jgi:hypothetical protein
MKTKPKTLPPRELDADWYPNKPNMEPDARIKRIMAHNNTRFKKLLEETPKNEQATPEFSKVFTLKDKQWKHTGYKCLNCGKLYSDESIIDKHPQICTNSLKINKSEEDFILSRVRKQNASTQDE